MILLTFVGNETTKIILLFLEYNLWQCILWLQFSFSVSVVRNFENDDDILLVVGFFV